MNKGNIVSPAEVDFWLNTDKYLDFFQETVDPADKTLVFNVDMIRLSSIRKAIANFVRILTRRNIPVYFNDANANVNFEGKMIYISAQINTKYDFDVAVGQALHEGAHSLKTNYSIVKSAWANIPSSILKLSDSKNVRRKSLEKFIHNMWNVIEDRYIDNYVFNEAPGYRGYYVALYDRFWHNPNVSEMLLDPDLFRYPSLKSYDFRITNFTNTNTDLLALPRLDDIAKTIDISHIDRLKSTKDRVKTAFGVVEIVLDCLDKENSNDDQSSNKEKNKLANPRDYFDFGDFGGDGPKKEVDVSKDAIKEIADVLGGKNKNPEKLKENDNIVNRISADEMDKGSSKQINTIIETQHQFLNGELPKSILTDHQKSLLDLVEKHGIVLVRVDLPGDDKNLKIDCVVVQKMTKELIMAGKSVFPLTSVEQIGDFIPEPSKDCMNAVKSGILLGSKLGRKLQIRTEETPTKSIRKKWGKINRRQLHEAAFDAEDLFYKITIDSHPMATLHITVDASGSMHGKKWERTMTAVVAICKAASMINNVHVTVSFRSTQISGNTELPYIVMAYDSKIDKFSKIRTLFPYLCPGRQTPEGLAFSATMDLFEGITPDEEERYFLNLSDGEPYYYLFNPSNGQIVHYCNEVGVTHTKAQVDKIRKHGVEILSYFIEDGGCCSKFIKKQQLSLERTQLGKNFRKMYGPSAKFVDVESVVDLARTINDLFLHGSSEKKA